MRLRVLTHGGDPIRCDPSGCCTWLARTSVEAARRRLYEASRGALPEAARLEIVCGVGRCVNLDHLRVVAGSRRVRGLSGTGTRQCQRGHDLTTHNVVRHRDGRIAYCRICRNERRRERYQSDTQFAQHERARQGVLRKRSAKSARRGPRPA